VHACINGIASGKLENEKCTIVRFHGRLG